MGNQSIPPTPPQIGPTAPTLAQMDTAGQDIALAYWELGYHEGVAVGRAQVEAEDAAQWAWMRQHIRSIAAAPKYADLAHRRGQHQRAERAEQILREWGVGA